MSSTDITIATDQQRPTRKRTILGRTIDIQAIAVVLGIFLTTRLLLVLIVFLSSAAIPMPTGTYGYATPDNLVLDGLVRHDSWWYISIVEHGYTIGDIKTGEQGTVTFFPLYPLLIKAVAGLTGDVFTAGVLVSQVAFLAALGFVYALARREFDPQTAARATFYLAAAPSSIFFLSIYTESLFIALVCATFYFSSRRMWEWAAVAGALGAATRNTGVLLAAVVVLEGMHHQGVRFRPDRLLGPTIGATAQLWWSHLRQQVRLAFTSWPSMLAASYVLIGLIAYMAFLQITFGDALGFIHAQATWGRSSAGNGILKLADNIVTNLRLGANPWAGQLNTLTVLNVLSTISFVPLTLMVMLRLRPAYGIYSLLTLYIPLSTGTVGSMTRYVLMLMPCFLLLAVWGRRGWVDRLVLGIFLPMTAYFAILFSHWYFVG